MTTGLVISGAGWRPPAIWNAIARAFQIRWSPSIERAFSVWRVIRSEQGLLAGQEKQVQLRCGG